MVYNEVTISQKVGSTFQKGEQDKGQHSLDNIGEKGRDLG